MDVMTVAVTACSMFYVFSCVRCCKSEKYISLRFLFLKKVLLVKIIAFLNETSQVIHPRTVIKESS